MDQLANFVGHDRAADLEIIVRDIAMDLRGMGAFLKRSVRVPLVVKEYLSLGSVA